MQVKIAASCVLIALISLVAQASHGNAMSPERTTVCKIMQNPRQFNHALVKVRAKIDSYGPELLIMIDDNCPAKVLHFDDFLHDGNDTPGRLRLRDAVGRMYLHNKNASKGNHLVVLATVTGIVSESTNHTYRFSVKDGADIATHRAAIWVGVSQ